MLNEQLSSDESRDLLLAVDRMRELLLDERVTLPEIVVVGDQSVGKSSVLEAISGIQLPRAQNICTRCPLELRMKTASNQEYATIRSSASSAKEKRIDDFTTIAAEVTRLTSEIAGDGVNVSANPIYLTVYKHDIPYDLTLVDLPGITRNAISGQADDIHEQILSLINKYIEPSTAIVLHVIPASTDFTTSESMKLAKKFDPQCQRQLIAASKIDKFDKGIAEKLQGRGSGSMDLQLGCVAVLNRNQHEIDENISFEEMRKREKQFFIDHKDEFQGLPDEYKGSEQLVRRLATIQQERIRLTLPGIIKDLKKQIMEKKNKLKKLPASLNTEADCWTIFQSMINAFRESINDNVKGEYDQVASMDTVQHKTTLTTQDNQLESEYILGESDEDYKEDENHIAYYIYQIQRKFQDDCRESFTNFFSPQYHKTVLREIDRAAGISLPNFPSYQIIVGLFRKELQKLPECCRNAVEQMHEYTNRCLLQLFDQAFSNDYPRLKQRLKDTIGKELSDKKEKLQERVEEILDTERRVFTLNHYYMDTVNKVKQDMKKIKEQSSTASSSSTFVQKVKTVSDELAYASMSNEAQAAIDIQISLHSYSKVVEKRITDNIAQVCYYHFITKCALKMDELLSCSVPSSQLLQYMREPQQQTLLRNKLTHSIQACEEALQLGQKHI
ncbi:unnamed protein product [Adineta ricciae]|uniref:Uncharacterized protein n=1 Tax=Adineta ricciae TaxID=249248 RepID=A0A813Y5A7_ADIRI|nr:unnamed protein product [Adineta ricciae]CAF1353369.1 unnamed protein product [Adineta ricciae]